MNISLIVFSNSQYKYLGDIWEDSVKNIKLNKIFISDKEYEKEPNHFDQYLKYDSSINYANRWISLLPQIKSEYIIVIHDVDLLLNFDENIFKNYFELIQEHKIDRLSLSIFKGDDIIEKNELYQICNLKDLQSSHHFTPYDVCPSVWNKDSFFNLWRSFPNETYASSEFNQELKIYCKSKLKCYGINLTKIIESKYCRGLSFSSFFKFLHITTGGKLLLPFEVYMDCKDDLLKIIQKYNLRFDFENGKDVLNFFKPLAS